MNSLDWKRKDIKIWTKKLGKNLWENRRETRKRSWKEIIRNLLHSRRHENLGGSRVTTLERDVRKTDRGGWGHENICGLKNII